jgi:hypothetical protein
LPCLVKLTLNDYELNLLIVTQNIFDLISMEIKKHKITPAFLESIKKGNQYNQWTNKLRMGHEKEAKNKVRKLPK